MIECTRIINFDAAHRVVGHENKCQHLHGHRYRIEASFRAETLDNLGMVIDFGVIKEILGGWINKNWDHTTILYEKDKGLGENIAMVTGQNIFYLPTNPTAENMAIYLFNEVCPEIFKNHKVICTKIRLHETPNCYTEAY